MNECVRDIIDTYQKNHPGIDIIPVFSGSGVLAKQISHGAPVDIYLSANPAWMNFLMERSNMMNQTVQTIAHNRLVFIGDNTPEINTIEDIKSLDRIAIGNPKNVPAGTYCAQALMAKNIYNYLINDNKLVLTKDVRQALFYVDRKEVDGAFVYRTDALLARNGSILFTVPENLHDKISYLIGLTVRGGKNKDAAKFLSFFQSSDVEKILEKHGFELAAN